MNIIESPQELQKLIKTWHVEGKSVGLVPTMGALHAGHLSLCERARSENDRFVASVFVNPSQFGPHEDLRQYPRPFERDCELLEAAGCDVIFAPTPAAMYGPEAPHSSRSHGIHTWVDVAKLGEIWEGVVRPGHLRGVATVVTMLLNIARPDRAYFGEKDYQQLKVIERLVQDLHFDTKIVACETVREADGLALSSRNVYLAPDEREASVLLSQALLHGVELAKNGERDIAALGRAMQGICERDALVSVQYIAIVDAETLNPIERLDGRVGRVLIAARVGHTRLIDNFPIQ
jgi:pantoate--beta-alanine ligase